MFIKRLFDITSAAIALLLLFWILVPCWIAAMIDTRTNGIFRQKRIGRHGLPFTMYKLRTIHPLTGKKSAFARRLRSLKIDELPQLINVLQGTMSMVGPRPDIPGYYDLLTGPVREILKLRPGITGPASLKYINEEELLKEQPDPEVYNDTVIFPDKIRINLEYQKKWTLWLDIKIIVYTILKIKNKTI